ncbi:MAG: hypothetical protein Q8R66_09480 [Methanobacteriaceae archaeon]|nr:hypothetical protein [Methanobacteriaceae archaeon]
MRLTIQSIKQTVRYKIPRPIANINKGRSFSAFRRDSDVIP